MEIKERNFGFIPSEMDGSEWIFAAPKSMVALPKNYTYKPYLPAVIDQGSLSICVPCSISAYINWKKNLITGENDVDNKVDLMEIYNCKTNDGEGMSFKEALRFLRHHGVNTKDGYVKINAYSRITNINLLKTALIMNGPCIGALPVYSDRCEFWRKERGDRLMGYHAISIVGYDDEGFIIRNSWGKSFCEKGYTHIDYEDMDEFIELWTIMD